MEGAEKIIKRILEDAQKQAQINIENGEKQAAEIMNAAREEAEKKKKELIDKARKEASELERRLISNAELEARKMKLKAKQDIIASVFKRALDRLNSLPSERYMDLISDMVLNSVKEGQYEIVFSREDKSRVNDGFINRINQKLEERKIPARVKLSEDDARINGGFIIRAGPVEINNSFEALLRMKYNEIEAEIVKILFK